MEGLVRVGGRKGKWEEGWPGWANGKDGNWMVGN